MLKKIINLFLLISIALFVLAFLYVFDLPPFTPKVNTTPTIELNPEDNLAQVEAAKLEEEAARLPEELQEKKVSRAKSYEQSIARANLLEKGGFPTLAVAEYQAAYQKDPSNLSPLYQIGKIYLADGNYSKAQAMFEHILRLDPGNNDAHIYLGQSYIAQRELSKAKELFDSLEGGTQKIKYYQGLLAAYTGDHDRAKAQLKATIDMNTDPRITNNARCFQNSYSEYQYNADSPTVHLSVLLARCFNQAEEYQISIPMLFEITREKVDYRDAWILLGYAYLKLEQYPDAIEALERAITLDPLKAESNFFLGLAYYSVNDFEKAENYLTKAQELGFEPEIYIVQKLAEIHLQMQNHELSAKNYEKLISYNHEDVDYYIRPIWLYIEKLNNPERALVLAESALKHHPDNAMSHNLMAWSLIYNGEFEQAESQLKTAMAMDPYLDAVYLNYGLLFEQKKQYKNAVNFYRKAHSLGEGNGVSQVAADRFNKILQANLLEQ